MILDKKSRPVNLNIKTIKFPITAIASILHRISGFILFLSIGPILWILKLSLSSEKKFSQIIEFLFANNCFFCFLKWNITIIFSYHIIFGIRQMLMDFGFLKQTLLVGRISSMVVFTLVFLISIYFGICIYDTH